MTTAIKTFIWYIWTNNIYNEIIVKINIVRSSYAVVNIFIKLYKPNISIVWLEIENK
jgi:hypothetical protein